MKNESTFSTSKEAYDWCIENGVISKRVADVLKVMADDMMPMNQTMAYNAVVKDTGNVALEKYSVSPRFAVLERMGLIEEAEKSACPVTGRTTVFYRLTLRKPVMSEGEAVKNAGKRALVSSLKAELKELKEKCAKLEELLNMRSASHAERQRRIAAAPRQTQAEMFPS